MSAILFYISLRIIFSVKKMYLAKLAFLIKFGNKIIQTNQNVYIQKFFSFCAHLIVKKQRM